MVRLRQILYDLARGLMVVPLAFVVVGIALAQVMTAIDAALGDSALPQWLETSVDGGRAILAAIAGGLISSVTLLLSLVLVAVQLASSQFSPRTLRGWTSDRTQQVAIGLVLGTSVYCLLVLRETRALDDGVVVTPDVSVLLAVALGVLSLIAVLRSVDHLTSSLRIGSVARSIAEDTVVLVRDRGEALKLERPRLSMSSHSGPGDCDAIPDDAEPVVSDRPGWVQQIDEDALFGALPDGSTAHMATALGRYAMPQAPIVWVSPPPPDDGSAARIRASIALGEERTLQQDIGYGILQLTDIALRALSPGTNDPNTANDVIVHLGVILLEIWENPEQDRVRSEDGKTLVRRDLRHSEFLRASFDPLRRYGAADADVVANMVQTLLTLRSETQRRDLPGPIDPIDETIEAIRHEFLRSDPAPIDKQKVLDILDRDR